MDAGVEAATPHASSRFEFKLYPDDCNGFRERTSTDSESAFYDARSPRMSCVRLKIAAWPLHRARITSNPMMAA